MNQERPDFSEFSILYSYSCFKSHLKCQYQSPIALETSSLSLPPSSLPATSLPGEAAIHSALALSYTALLGCTVHTARWSQTTAFSKAGTPVWVSFTSSRILIFIKLVRDSKTFRSLLLCLIWLKVDSEVTLRQKAATHSMCVLTMTPERPSSNPQISVSLQTDTNTGT